MQMNEAWFQRLARSYNLKAELCR